MMRRARWLAAGAVLGVLGYQRVRRAATSLTSSPDPGSAARQAVGVVAVTASAAGRGVGAAGWLIRQARRRRAAVERRPRGGAAAFIADVRAGMDDYLGQHQAYMNRQHRRSGNTLVAQRAPDRPEDAGPPAGTAGRLRHDDETKDGR